MNYERITATDMYSRGFIKAGTKQADDAKYFIEAIISNPYEDLIAENTSTNTYVGYFKSGEGCERFNSEKI